MASSSAASFGASSSCSAWMTGVVLADPIALKTRLTRWSSCPLFSRATSVFSKLGAAGFAAIAAISSSSALMPASSAGL